MSSLPPSGLVQELGRSPLASVNEQTVVLQSSPAALVDDECSCLRNTGKGTASSPTYLISARSWYSHLESCLRSLGHTLQWHCSWLWVRGPERQGGYCAQEKVWVQSRVILQDGRQISGFTCCGAQALGIQASVAAACGLQSVAQ